MAINHGSLSANLTPRGVVGGRVQNSVLAYENDYENLINKPSINDTELNGDLSLEDLGIVNNVQPDWEQTDTEAGDYINNKPDIPENLSDLNDDADHRTVSDTEKTTWNNKSDFSGSYNDLTDKPVIPDAQIQSDWNQNDNTKVDYIKNKPSIPSAQIQSDWNESDSSKADFIKNKPTIPAEQVNSDWDAESGKAQILNKPSIPTALADLTDDSTHRTVTDTEKTAWNRGEANVQSNWNETDTTSDAYIQNKPSIPSVTANPGSTTATLSSIEIDGTSYAISGGGGGGAVNSVNGKTGDVTLGASDVGALPDDTPLFSGDYEDLTNKPTIPDDLADLNDDSTHRLVTDTEKTTWNGKSNFSGSYNDLSNKPTLGSASALDVASSGDASTTQVVKGDDSRLSDARTPVSHTHTTSDITDFPTMSDYIQKSNTSGLVKNDGTIDTNSYATTSQIPDITGKADKVTSAVDGNFAGLDSNGNLTDSGHKHSDYLTSHQDISGKADKVSGATNGNLAGLDANGNLTDAGWASDKTTTSATGNPISISGLKSNQLAKDPIITLEPIQEGSGDPSPSNVRAISGYDKIEVLSLRKNLFNYDAWKNCVVSNGTGVYENNGVTLTATANDCFTDYAYLPEEAYIYVKTGDIVTLSWDIIGTINNGNVFIFGNAGTSSMVQTSASSKSLSYTVPEGVTFITFRVGVSNAGDTMAYSNIQIELGSTATAYEPYKEGCNIQLTLGQTIYGGTLDVEKGILRVDRAYYTFDGTETVAEKDIYSRFWINLPSYEPVCATATTDISSHFKNSNGTSGMEDMGGSVADISWENPKRTVYICKNSNISTTADMTAWLTTQYNNGTPLQICYAIKNPYTIQLTPHEISLLKDYAYVSTNGTNMQFSYKNGEMASLGDVAQVGQTVNELGRELTERIKKTVVSISSTDILPLGYDDTLCPIVAPASGYRVLSFYFKSYGRYGTYLLWGLALDEGKIVASNTHPIETATASGDMVIYWVKI